MRDLNDLKAISHYVEAMLGEKKSEHHLSFVHESDGGWYIDMPWNGNHHDLAMVAGSDKLLSFLDAEDKRRVNVHVIPSANQRTDLPDYIELEQKEWSWLGGSTYDVHNCPGFTSQIWICPVTLTVLHEYPSYIYLKIE